MIRQESRGAITAFDVRRTREKPVTLVELFQRTAVEHNLGTCFHIHGGQEEGSLDELWGHIKFGGEETKIVGRVDLEAGTFTAFHVNFVGPNSGLFYSVLKDVLSHLFEELQALVVWDEGRTGVVDLSVFRGEVTEKEV